MKVILCGPHDGYEKMFLIEADLFPTSVVEKLKKRAQKIHKNDPTDGANTLDLFFEVFQRFTLKA